MIDTPSRLTITSSKYDGEFRFSMDVDLLYASSSLLLARGQPGRVIRRSDGVRLSPYWSLEYLPLDRPYNIVSFFTRDGAIDHHFCNVLVSPRLENDVLSYIDLDLDVVVRPDGKYRVEDREQFEVNALVMRYPSDLVDLAQSALRDLVCLAEQRGHLFSCTRLDEAQQLLLSLYGELGSCG
ncbi:MAG: DUF402 domain-containing protein [Chloroflexota bacterium]|nr:DUF402 domain-containing protein [Chloroflexota bacterium]